jgi:acyl-CoA thioesterase-1
VMVGDSLTEGYQLDKEQAFPALIEIELRKIKPQIKVINAGISGATSASGPKRLLWYKKIKPQILVLALGANDGLRGLRLEETKRNLVLTINEAVKNQMKVLLVGMKMPTNYGQSYRMEFEKMYREIARELKVPLVPFLLEGVAGHRHLNLPDGIHPNANGHQVMAKTVLPYLQALL